MLYVTTRSDREHHSALRPLGYDRGPDGGMYVPFRLPKYDYAAVDALREKSFGDCVADVLNQLFTPVLTGSAVDFSIGRTPVKHTTMNHRIVVAECWHNPKWNFDWVVHNLTQQIRAESQRSEHVTEWARIAVRIAMLFGIFGELERTGAGDWAHPVDVAVDASDFTAPMAAWYAREMGLPIGVIICCTENGASWDLIHRGELRTADACEIQDGLERLIAATLGAAEAIHFCEICSRSGSYIPKPEQLEQLRRGMYASVVSRRRMDRVMSTVYRTNAYVLSPVAASIYAGLQDYRATAGEGRLALILAEQKPANWADAVASALGMTADELRTRLDRN